MYWISTYIPQYYFTHCNIILTRHFARRSSEGLKRSQSEPGNSFMFSSPGGHTPAGSAAGVVKNKLKMKMENISEISDLSQVRKRRGAKRRAEKAHL